MIRLLTTVLVLFLILFAMYLSQGKVNATVSTSEIWTSWTTQKHLKLMKLWYSKDLSKYIINKCKKEASDPAHCVIIAWIIWKAESNAGQNASTNNVFWINEGKKYDTKEKNVDRWMKSYVKYWYKRKWPADFYPNKWEVAPTRYCTGEESSGSNIGCPNGRRIATEAFYFLKS
jgi:hypothetical protein